MLLSLLQLRLLKVKFFSRYLIEFTIKLYFKTFKVRGVLIQLNCAIKVFPKGCNIQGVFFLLGQ